MKKIIIACLIGIYTLSISIPVFAVTLKGIEEDPIKVTPIDYPEGADFVQLKKLVDSTFFQQTGVQYGCISGGSLCPNYKYTSIVEKAIKLIVLKTYIGNETFYDSLFANSYSYRGTTEKGTLKGILAMIPQGTVFSDWRNLSFGRSVPGELIDASFGIDFSENKDPNSLLGAIERKIIELKYTKCQKENTGNNSYDICPPWSGGISNQYLPTLEELLREVIYLDGDSVKLESMKDEFDYTVTFVEQAALGPQATPVLLSTDSILALIPTESAYYQAIKTRLVQLQSPSIPADVSNNIRIILLFTENDSLITPSNKIAIKKLIDDFTSKSQESATPVGPISESYTLTYKKNSYTLEEAKKLLEKKAEPVISSTFTRSGGFSGSLPCTTLAKSTSARSECLEANSLRKDIMTALGAYYSDKEAFPDTIDALTLTYLEVDSALPSFKKNFTYKNISSASMPDFEITYIGHIGEGSTASGELEGKKDYKALMNGASVPEIPAIFSHIPSDSMVLYIKNPQSLIALLNQKSDTTRQLSGIDVSEDIKSAIMNFFELKNFGEIEKNLTHEMAIAIDTLDATSPDIVLILSEADRAALSPSAKARVVGSQGGYIFVANSKTSLERYTALDTSKSLRDASDFHYVWWKKNERIQDAFVFVGDAFFEKMLSFETYITHYRKYRDYTELSMLQELVWAYNDAFGSYPKSLSDISTEGLPLFNSDALNRYSLQEGKVTHKNIGSLVSIKTLPETQYDLTKISRSEIDDYKYNVLKYREVWRSSLDPMGIVLNRHGDGIEIDFFMTPIPSTTDRDMQELQEIFEGVTKDELSFVTNQHIPSGLFSFVFGFDPKKLLEKIQSDENIAGGFEEFNKEVLDGKNIFDYLGGEFAWSIGDLDLDILDGWNIEKINVYGSIQVKSEEKGKELIDTLRTRILKEMGDARGDEIEMIKGFLAKPLIEDYSGKKIYYVEGLPIPFVGKIGFAYTFIDDFFMIGLNRSTIKHIIDGSQGGDSAKEEFIAKTPFSKGTFFAMLFDGVNTSLKLKELYEKNKSSIPRYMRYLGLEGMRNNGGNNFFIGAYYSAQDRNKRLGREMNPFSYTLGTLSVSGDIENVSVRIDTGKVKSFTGITLQMWNNIESEGTFPKEILSEKGIPLENFLALSNMEDIIALNIIAHFDIAMNGSESLLRNMTFGFNMGDDEIGFNIRLFRKLDQTQGTVSTQGSSFLLWGMIGGFVFVVVLVGGFIVYRRNKQNHGDASMNTSIPDSVLSSKESSDESMIIATPGVEETLIVPPVQSIPESPVEPVNMLSQVPESVIQTEPIHITTPDTSTVVVTEQPNEVK
ncbi:hypothetical protein KBD33_02800 [Candidatus Gracilibacteria bacterium]|nr:hypothetical protein [Candidatus Gracilibacteria bacterium]